MRHSLLSVWNRVVGEFIQASQIGSYPVVKNLVWPPNYLMEVIK